MEKTMLQKKLNNLDSDLFFIIQQRIQETLRHCSIVGGHVLAIEKASLDKQNYEVYYESQTEWLYRLIINCDNDFTSSQGITYREVAAVVSDNKGNFILHPDYQSIMRKRLKEYYNE